MSSKWYRCEQCEAPCIVCIELPPTSIIDKPIHDKCLCLHGGKARWILIQDPVIISFAPKQAGSDNHDVVY